MMTYLTWVLPSVSATAASVSVHVSIAGTAVYEQGYLARVPHETLRWNSDTNLYHTANHAVADAVVATFYYVSLVFPSNVPRGLTDSNVLETSINSGGNSSRTWANSPGMINTWYIPLVLVFRLR